MERKPRSPAREPDPPLPGEASEPERPVPAEERRREETPADKPSQAEGERDR